MRIGLVGYGTGGQHFHAPFITAAEDIELVGIVARSPGRVAAARADFPEVPIYDSLSSMIAGGNLDAVTITTPPATRRELVLEAIDAGLHVVADKPFAPNAAGGRELEEAARARGVTLGVFHNRRYDTDFLSLRKVVESNRLGRIWRVHSRLDYDDPATLEAGPQGGLLRDLGSHLIDQMVCLLGPVASVDAQLDDIELPEGPTNATFSLTLRHRSGAHSHLCASKINRLQTKEFIVYAEKGSYVSSATDVQAQAIFAGKRPIDDPAGWGYEREELWGRLRTTTGIDERIPSEQGRYHDYYTAFARAVREGTPAPVTAEEAILTLQVLDAAYISAREGRVVAIGE